MAIQDKKVKAGSDVYTAMLAVASLAVISTAAYVAIMCYGYYGTIFKVAQP